jgi:hypothetical protein
MKVEQQSVDALRAKSTTFQALTAAAGGGRTFADWLAGMRSGDRPTSFSGIAVEIENLYGTRVNYSTVRNWIIALGIRSERSSEEGAPLESPPK